MREAKRVAVNTGFLYGRMAITVFISLYATRLILNALGAEDFGLFSVVGGAIAMLTFLNNAMATATQRFMSFAQGEGNSEKQKNIFNVSLVLHFIIAILVVLLLELAAYFLFNGILNISSERIQVAKLIYQFLVISTFFTILSVPYDAVINAHENMFIVAILGILEALLKLVIAIYITTTSHDKLISYGLLMSLLALLLLILRQIYCRRKYQEVQINFKAYFSKPLFKEMTHFASWSLLGCSSSMIANYGQGIIINMFFGTVVNAAQGIANQVSGQLGAFSSTMLKALNPLIAKSEGAGNRKLMLDASMFGSKISFFLLMFFIVPALIEMRFILTIWLKNVPEYAVIFCSLLLIRNLIEQLYVTLNTAIGAVGNIKKPQIVTSFFYIIPLIISYLLFLLDFPAYTLYFVFIISSILLTIVALYFAKLSCELSIKQYFKDVILPCILSILLIYILGSIPKIFMKEGFIRLLLVLIITIISSFVVIWIIGINKSERRRLKELFAGFMKKLKFKT